MMRGPCDRMNDSTPGPCCAEAIWARSRPPSQCAMRPPVPPRNERMRFEPRFRSRKARAAMDSARVKADLTQAQQVQNTQVVRRCQRHGEWVCDVLISPCKNGSKSN